MKKLLLSHTMLLMSIGAFSQLTVKPTASGADSFVYVKDEILYVKDYINLTANAVAQQEASIYLRDKAQLIQGGTTSSNTGNGFLSVQQTAPETNGSAYYYWASPVGNPAADGNPLNSGNKNFGVGSIYENTNPLGIQATKALTTAGRDGTSSPLTISTYWLYTLQTPGTERLGDYTRMNGNDLAPAGYGFTMKGVDLNTHAQLYEFRGRPNNGDFTIQVQGPAGGGGNNPANVEARMTLSGNPYPSALDLNWLFHDSDNLALDAFYFYDEDRNNYSHSYGTKSFGYGVYLPGAYDPTGTSEVGVYTSASFTLWNPDGGNNGGSTGTGYGGPAKHRFAPIGQGIMFVGKTATPTDIKIKNAHRRYIKQDALNSSVFHRAASETNEIVSNDENRPSRSVTPIPLTPAEIDNRMPQTRLFVTFDDALTRDMLLTFSTQASDGYDRGFDGQHPGGMKSDAYFPIEINNERRPFVINGTNFSMEKRIPISFKLHSPGRVNVRVAEEIRKPYERIYLYDHKEVSYLELNINDREGIAFGLPAGQYDDRYYIVFQKEDIEILPWPKAALDDFMTSVVLFQNNPVQRLEVRNPEGYNIKSVNVYDMSGKLVIKEKNLGDNNSYSFYTGHLSDGVYLVKLLTVDDMPIDYKAIVINK